MIAINDNGTDPPPDGPKPVQVRMPDWSKVRVQAQKGISHARGKFWRPQPAAPAPPTTPAPFSTLAPHGFRSRAMEYAQFDAANLADEAMETVTRNKNIYDRATWLFILANVPRQVFYFLSLMPSPPKWVESQVWDSVLAYFAFVGVIAIFAVIPLGIDMLLRAAIRQVSTSAISWGQRGPSLVIMLALIAVSAFISYSTPLPEGLQQHRWLMTVPTIGVAAAQFLSALCTPSNKIIREKERQAFYDAGLVEPVAPPPPVNIVLPPPPPPPRTRPPIEELRRRRGEALKMAMEDPNVRPATLMKETSIAFETAKAVIAEAKEKRAAAAAQAEAEAEQARRDKIKEDRRQRRLANKNKAPDAPDQPDAKTPDAPDQPDAKVSEESPKPRTAPRPRVRVDRRPAPGAPKLPDPSGDDKGTSLLDGAFKASGRTRTKKVNGKVPAGV